MSSSSKYGPRGSWWCAAPPSSCYTSSCTVTVSSFITLELANGLLPNVVSPLAASVIGNVVKTYGEFMGIVPQVSVFPPMKASSSAGSYVYAITLTYPTAVVGDDGTPVQLPQLVTALPSLAEGLTVAFAADGPGNNAVLSAVNALLATQVTVDAAHFAPFTASTVA